MIKDIIRAFTSKTPAKLETHDAHIALAALMVRLARTDGDYAQVEISTIDRALSKLFDLEADAAIKLRLEAEELEPHAPDNVRFTRVIKDGIDYEERADVVEALWSVVLADGQRDHEEDGFMRLVANLLGVNDRDSAFARQRAVQNLD